MKYLIGNINDYIEEEIDLFLNNIYEKKNIKINKYLKKVDKFRATIGEILLSNLVDDYYNLEFYTNKYGKPYIKNKDIFFNISKSFDYVICAISNKEIGVDIEKVRDVDFSFIKRFTTKNEKKYILKSKDGLMDRIFQIYTLKEAYFKCKGINLKSMLKVEFTINDDEVICSDESVNIRFINDIEGYYIALCEEKK